MKNTLESMNVSDVSTVVPDGQAEEGERKDNHDLHTHTHTHTHTHSLTEHNHIKGALPR